MSSNHTLLYLIFHNESPFYSEITPVKIERGEIRINKFKPSVPSEGLVHIYVFLYADGQVRGYLDEITKASLCPATLDILTLKVLGLLREEVEK